MSVRNKGLDWLFNENLQQHLFSPSQLWLLVWWKCQRFLWLCENTFIGALIYIWAHSLAAPLQHTHNPIASALTETASAKWKTATLYVYSGWVVLGIYPLLRLLHGFTAKIVHCRILWEVWQISTDGFLNLVLLSPSQQLLSLWRKKRKWTSSIWSFWSRQCQRTKS